MHTVDRSYYTCMANWTVSYKVGRARRTARWIVHTTHQLYLGGGSDLASCSLLPLENKHPMTDHTTYASPLYFITCGLRTLPCVPLEAQDVGVSWHCVLRPKFYLTHPRPPFDWATELLPLMALEAIKYDETGLHVLNQLLLPGKTHYEEVKSVEDAWDAIKTMKVLGSTWFTAW